MSTSTAAETGRVYVGIRTAEGLAVNVQRPDARGAHAIRRLRHYEWHSPTGFECGYAGSGPADLALAILADYLRDPRLAALKHQAFKADVVAHLPANRDWRLPEERVRDWCAANVSEADRAEARSWRRRPLREMGIRAIH